MKSILILAAASLVWVGQASGQGLEACAVKGLSARVLCTQVEVPEDHRTGGGHSIELRVMVLPGVGERDPDPVFIISGGPGQAATDLVEGYARSKKGAWATRDLVFVDQRGTGGSNSLACEVPDDPAAFFGRVLPSDETLHSCLLQLMSHADPRLYTTTQTVEDLEAVRRSLGYGAINISGGSYGTRVVLEYLRRHPSSIRTAMMSGAVPPDFRAPLMYAGYAQRALDALFEDCRQDPACHAKYPEVAEEWEGLLYRLHASAARVRLEGPGGDTTTVLMSAHDLGYAVRSMLYGAEALVVPSRIHEAATSGDLSFFAQSYARRAGFVWSAVSVGLHLSVFCSEDVPFIGDQEMTAATRGTYLGTYLVDEYRRACRLWPRGEIPADFLEPVVSDRPVLVLSGRRDPSTPTATGAAVLAYFSQGAHLVHHFGGHGFGGTPDQECADRVIRRFLASGTTRGLDLGCVDSERPLPFRVSGDPSVYPDQVMGWYRSESGDRMLVSPGPGGGWRHLDFTAADFGALEFGPDGEDARFLASDHGGHPLLFRGTVGSRSRTSLRRGRGPFQVRGGSSRRSAPEAGVPTGRSGYGRRPRVR